MKKALISTIAVVLILVSAYYAYTYYNGPKITEGVVSENVNDKGKPIGIKTEFSPEDTVCFSAKSNKFWIQKAQVVWYKGEIATENRFLVEEGHYSVSIYVAGKNIIETRTEFDVKK